MGLRGRHAWAPATLRLLQFFRRFQCLYFVLQGQAQLRIDDASIGKRCHELRIPDEDKTWRIVYRIDTDAILVLEVFKKTTEKTPSTVIDACKERIKRYDEL